MTDAYKCPSCGHVIRATNIEWLYPDGDSSSVVHADWTMELTFDRDTYAIGEGAQLHYCPNDSCPIVRLFPTDSSVEEEIEV